MNKGVVIGVTIVIIIVGIIGVTSLNFEASNNSVVEDIAEESEVVEELKIAEESEVVEELKIAEESEEKGRDLSVELTESVGLKSP